MGCVPSRELHESPQTLHFISSGPHKLARIPLTPHFFPSHNSLAFQQLYKCRNSQSAKYEFTLLPSHITDINNNTDNNNNNNNNDEIMPYRRLRRRYELLKSNVVENLINNNNNNENMEEESWDAVCEEELELDPSLPPRNYTNIISHEKEEKTNSRVKNLICDGSEELYKVLITQGTMPVMTDTNEEMIQLYEEECKWRDAREVICQNKQRSINNNNSKNINNNNKEKDTGAIQAAKRVSPPRRFLHGLSCAILKVISSNDNLNDSSVPETLNIPSDGKLHLVEYNGTLFLAARQKQEEENNNNNNNNKEGNFIISPTPVRVVGCDGLLPSLCRGPSWLHELTEEEEEEQYYEKEKKEEKENYNLPPVLRICRFCEETLSVVALCHTCMMGLFHDLKHSQSLGLTFPFTRPLWQLNNASNISFLHTCVEARELSYNVNCSKGISVSLRGSRLLLRIQEKMVRAVCLLCAASNGLMSCLGYPSILKKQNNNNNNNNNNNTDSEESEEDYITSYEFGGCIGIHPETGVLCVPLRVQKLLQKKQNLTVTADIPNLNNNNNNNNNTETKVPLLVFAITAPCETTRNSMNTKLNKENKMNNFNKTDYTFYDGDLAVYDTIYQRWIPPPSSSSSQSALSQNLTLENILLSWVKKTLAGATFRQNDNEWLRDQHHHIVQDGRFYIWRIIHDELPYFFGVIPKFAKERRRRQKAKERNNQSKQEKIKEQKHQDKKKEQEQEEHKQEEKHESIIVEIPIRGPLTSKKYTPTHSHRHAEVAKYFRNGCFTWNPYGIRR